MKSKKQKECVDCGGKAVHMVRINKRFNITYPLCNECKDRREGKRNV